MRPGSRCGVVLAAALAVGGAASPSRGQEATEATGLEVEDPWRLGVTVIASRGIDNDTLRRAFEQEFALAGVAMTDGGDPRKEAVLVIWIGETVSVGETRSTGEDPGGWSRFKLSNYRLEFWRPVHYETGEGEHSIAGITWVMRGGAGGGYRVSSGHSLTEAVCLTTSETLRNFLTLFLEANGRTYTPPDAAPSCDRGD